MGTKSANSDSKRISKTELAKFVMSYTVHAKQIDAARNELYMLQKQLANDPDCLSGDRAETYADFLKQVQKFIDMIADTSLSVKRVVTERCQTLQLEIDHTKVDAQLQDANSRVERARAKKLKNR